MSDVPRAHVCSFSALGDLPRKAYGNPQAVLAAMVRAGRFSTFEVSDNQRLARTVTALYHDLGWLKLNNDLGYPWTKVVLTPAGAAAIAERTKP